MGLNVGDLVHDVTIQALAESTADSGFPGEDWPTLCLAWMSQAPGRGQERYAAGQLSASAETRWQMRWVPSMDPDSVDVAKKRRLLYQGRVHDITSASMIGRREGIELLTLAKVG